MFQKSKQFSIINRIFNVQGNEWPRILFAWAVRLLYRIGFVIGWTIMVVLVVGHYGIAFLPYLFIINAIFIVIGSMIYSLLIEKVTKSDLMVGTIFLAGMILLMALAVFPYSFELFIALLIVSEAVFLMQFRIIMIGFTEKMFTPLESARTFPLIEAAETVGGIIGGLLLVYFSENFDAKSFVYLWVLFLFMIIPTMLIYLGRNERVRVLRISDEKGESIGLVTKIRKEFRAAKHMGFIKGLFLIVLLQWVLYNLLEFQYTKAVFQNVSSAVLETASGIEHTFIHDLGALFVLFSSLALLVQLFIGSRLINYLGVVGSMLIHPIVTLLSVIGLTGSFNFHTAVLAKNNFTVTSIVHTNAYHSAYYAVKEKLRDHTRELLEGVVRPMGAIVGTLMLILLQEIFVDDELILYVNFAMVLVASVLLIVTYYQQGAYTMIALNDLKSSNDREARLNAIDILGQRGHKANAKRALVKIVLDDEEDVHVRVHAIKILSLDAEAVYLPCLLEALSSHRAAVRQAAVSALFYFGSVLGNEEPVPGMYRSDILRKLKSIYSTKNSHELNASIVRLLAAMSSISTFDFLFKILEDANVKLKAEAIIALGQFQDPGVVEILDPYLTHKRVELRVAAIIALYGFDISNERAAFALDALLFSDNAKQITHGVYAVGELRLRSKMRFVKKYLDSHDEILSLNAALALAKMGDTSSVDALFKAVFESTPKISKMARQLIKNVDVRIFENVAKILKHAVALKIDEVVQNSHVNYLNRMKKKDLRALRWLYSLIDEHAEVEKIDKLLSK